MVPATYIDRPIVVAVMRQEKPVSHDRSKDYETSALKNMIDAFESDTFARRCRLCHAFWVLATLLSLGFVFYAYQNTDIEPVYLLFLAAFGGACGATAGLISNTQATNELLKKYVDVQAMKVRYEELSDA